MPWTDKQVRLLHAVDEGKSDKIPKATAEKMLSEQAGHKVLPPVSGKKKRRFKGKHK